MKHSFSNFKDSLVLIAEMLENKRQAKHYKEPNGFWVVEERVWRFTKTWKNLSRKLNAMIG